MKCLEVASSAPTTQLETGTCDYDENQEWTFQKRTSGEWAGSYRMVYKPTIGTNRVLCAVMSADYSSIDTNIKLGRCRGDNDGRADYQTFTVEDVPGGHAIRFATDHPYVYFYYTRLGVTKDDDNNDDVATIPAGNARNGIVAPTAAVTWEILQEAADFDDQIVQIYHVTDDSTGCLALPGVVTVECDDSVLQQWRLEKQTSGAYLVRSMAASQTTCLDNNGQFTTSSDMKARYCARNANLATDHGGYSTPANQSVTIAASGDGYTLTFTSGANSSWLTTDRASNSPGGGVGQTTVDRHRPRLGGLGHRDG